MKMQNSTLPKFGISIFDKFGFGKMKNRDTKIWNSISILNFWDRKSKSIPKIWKSAPQIRFRFLILGLEIRFSKFQNRFLQFLSNLNLRPSNLKSATSKTPKSTFSLQNSYFRFKFFFDQSFDFVLGIHFSVGDFHSNSLRNQLQTLGIALTVATAKLFPEQDREEEKEWKERIFTNVAQRLEDDHKKVFSRKRLIERRKEQNEKADAIQVQNDREVQEK